MDGWLVMSIFNLHARSAKTAAADWVARLHADDRTEADEQAFDRWLKEDPSHAAAFEAITTVWNDVSALKHEFKLVQPGLEPRFNRRRVFAVIGSLVGLGAVGGLISVAQAKTYQTGVGEQKHVVLDDGTGLILDTDTKLEVNFSIGRKIELHYGRANFRAAAGSSRPFTVKADRESITSSGSTFDVSRDRDRVSVVLIHGNAVVESGASGAQGKQELTDGQQLLVTNQQTLKLNNPYLLQLLAWQTGQAIFENNSVSQAVHEMNRYSQLKLQIVDSRIADLRISGVYRVRDNLMFARALSKLLPINYQQVGNGIALSGDNLRLTQG
jgi:transmembrane sensor